jgi:hypothetical protein
MTTTVVNPTIIEATLIPFNYNNRENINPDNLPKLTMQNISEHEKWTFWENLFAKTQVDYSKDKSDDKKYSLIENDVLHEAVKDVSKLYSKITDSREWFNNNRPEKEDVDVGNGEKISYFRKDPINAQKVTINGRDEEILILGDFHSAFHSLGDIIGANRRNFFVDGDTLEVKNNRFIIFLGDLLDRGPYNMEILYLAYKLKLANPYNVFIINGNHENENQWEYLWTEQIEVTSTGYELSHTRYVETQSIGGFVGQRYEAFKKCLWFLPSVIYLNFNGKNYHLSHGAFDPVCGNIDSVLLTNIASPVPPNTQYVSGFLKSTEEFWYITDELDTSQEDIRLDMFKWGDMRQENGINDTRPDRLVFGKNIIEQYLEKNKLECIISGHQDQVPLGLILSDKRLSNKCIDNVNLKHWNEFNIRPTNFYDFFLPENSLKKDYYKEIVLNLRPGDDFLALVTSSATIARKLVLNKNTYLVMKTNQNVGQDGGYSFNKNFEMKYLKYKRKYLDLKRRTLSIL